MGHGTKLTVCESTERTDTKRVKPSLQSHPNHMIQTSFESMLDFLPIGSPCSVRSEDKWTAALSVRHYMYFHSKKRKGNPVKRTTSALATTPTSAQYGPLWTMYISNPVVVDDPLCAVWTAMDHVARSFCG